MMGPPMNLGSIGRSEVVHGIKLSVGVLLDASSAKSDKGLLSKSGLLVDGCSAEVALSLWTLLVEDGGEGIVATYVDTICLLGAKVIVAGLALFKILGADTCLWPSFANVTGVGAAATNCTSRVGLASPDREANDGGGSTLTLTNPSFLPVVACKLVNAAAAEAPELVMAPPDTDADTPEVVECTMVRCWSWGKLLSGMLG